jgi:hypothetical protein
MDDGIRYHGGMDVSRSAGIVRPVEFLARSRPTGLGLVIASIVSLLAAAETAVHGQTPGRAGAVRRAEPPAGAWDPATSALFVPDAFALLPEGPRPVLDGRQASTGPQVAEPDPARSGPAAAAKERGFAWSALVSEDTLTDEVKDMKERVAAAAGSATVFKGGGYEKARDALTSLAMCFGVIAEFDGEVRWQRHAETARDLFARAGFNCKVGTDQSLAETKARIEDLGRLLDGSPPQGRSDRSEDFLWSQVAGRSPLMRRLEQAEATVLEATAAKADFDRQRDELRHAAEIIAMIGEVIQRPDFEDHDDQAYRGYAAAMRDAAATIPAAVERRDYPAARDAVVRVRKSCTDCHGDYRG